MAKTRVGTGGSHLQNQNLTKEQKLQTGNSPAMPTNLFGKVLKYPLNLEDSNGHYMIFNIHTRIGKDNTMDAVDMNVADEYKGTYNNTFTRERFFDDTTNLSWREGESGIPVKMIKDTVCLYMPDDVSVNFKSNYTPADIGAIGGMMAAAADALKGNTSFTQMLKSAGMQAAATIEPLLEFGSLGTGAGAMAALQRKTGLSAAPMQEMIFTGIDYRTFTYSFKMNPRNRKEAQEVKKIIDTFTYHMLPEKLGTGAALAFKVPSEFTIRYMYRGQDNQYLNHITFCALQDMKVDYGGGEKYVTYRADEIGAPPVTTNVTLTFTELELVDRRRAVTEGTHKTSSRQMADFQ